MGASSAIVGAYILAGEISSLGCHYKSHEETFKAYDTKFRPFMNQVQKGVGDPSILDKIPWCFVSAYVAGFMLEVGFTWGYTWR